MRRLQHSHDAPCATRVTHVPLPFRSLPSLAHSDSPLNMREYEGLHVSKRRRGSSGKEVVDLTDLSPLAGDRSTAADASTEVKTHAANKNLEASSVCSEHDKFGSTIGGIGAGVLGERGVTTERANTREGRAAEMVVAAGLQGGASSSGTPSREGTSPTLPLVTASSDVEDDEAFARQLQEEENARWREERAAAQRRAEDWRRRHAAMEAAIIGDDDDDYGEYDEEDEEDEEGEEVAREGAADIPTGTSARVGEGHGISGGSGRVQHGSSSGGPDGEHHRGNDRRRTATTAMRRMRMLEVQQFMGALTQHIHAAGSTPADRANLAALIFSDRDFTEDDYERLLALDNTTVKRGLSATALARIPVSTWAACGGAKEGRDRGAGEDHSRCAVCLEEYKKGDQVRHLPCLHSYHAKCIDRWFEASVECPVCKHDVNKLMD